MYRHAAFRRDFHSFPYLAWIHPRADVISSAVFIGSTAGRQKRKSGEIKASGTEKAVVVGGSKEIVGSLPEFANKTVPYRDQEAMHALTFGKCERISRRSVFAV